MPTPLSVLPHDLFLLVLAQLPPHHLSRLRSVCKTWNSTFSSPEFKQLYKQLRPHRDSWLFVHDVGGVKILTPEAQWVGFSFPSVYVRDWTAGGGLLCLHCHLSEIRETGYFVASALTRAWKQLPNPPETKFGRTWSIVRDVASSSYYIILIHNADATMQVYSSKTDDWSLKLLPPSIMGSDSLVDPVLASSSCAIGELIYSIHGFSRSVLVLDVKCDIWKQLDAPLPQALAFHMWQESHLVEMIPKIVEGPGGKILLVGGVSGACEETQWVGVVWKWDRLRMAWTEVARAPSEMWKAMLEDAKDNREPSLLPVRYSAEGNLIFVMASGCSRAIRYNVAYEKWDWLELPSTSNCELTMSTFESSSQARI